MTCVHTTPGFCQWFFAFSLSLSVTFDHLILILLHNNGNSYVVRKILARHSAGAWRSRNTKIHAQRSSAMRCLVFHFHRNHKTNSDARCHLSAACELFHSWLFIIVFWTKKKTIFSNFSYDNFFVIQKASIEFHYLVHLHPHCFQLSLIVVNNQEEKYCKLVGYLNVDILSGVKKWNELKD